MYIVQHFKENGANTQLIVKPLSGSLHSKRAQQISTEKPQELKCCKL